MNRIAILLGLGVAAISGGTVFALSQKSQVSAQSAPSSPAPAVKSQPTAVSRAPVAPAPTSQSLQISGCNGFPAHANFREYPSFSPRSILGVVEIGESINLTGRTTRANGERWYEAINPASLHPTPDAGAQNRLFANQVGWIAACFVNE